MVHKRSKIAEQNPYVRGYVTGRLEVRKNIARAKISGLLIPASLPGLLIERKASKVHKSDPGRWAAK